MFQSQLQEAFGAMTNLFERERCEEIAEYMIDHKATVRSAAVQFGVSKSTVHKDITEKLKHINPALHHEVGILLALNKSERHLRGGEATRKKYLKKQDAFAIDASKV
jgi:putative DeoR family transcriptional regulator (stage III sporulation protein D)